MPPATTRSCTDRRAPPDRAAPSRDRAGSGVPAADRPCYRARGPATDAPAARRHGEDAMPEFETLGYEESDGVAWVTLNRPDVMNSFNTTMQRELRSLWRWLRRHDDVRVVVLTGAGDKAFCTGIDRSEALAEGPRAGRARRRPTRRSRDRIGDDTGAHRLGHHAVHVRRPGREPRAQGQRPVEAGHRGGERHRLRRRLLHAGRGRLHDRRRPRHVLRPPPHLQHGGRPSSRCR